MLGVVGILDQRGQLQWVFADLLHWGQQEAIEGDVDHILQQLAGLTEIHVLVELGERAPCICWDGCWNPLNKSGSLLAGEHN